MGASTAILAFTVIFILVMIQRCPVDSKRYCSFFYFYSKAKKDCELCTDYCRPGTGLIRNCGYNEFGNRISPACSPCKEGYFNVAAQFPYIYRPSPPCQRCKQCFPASRTKIACTPTRNARCGRCPRGMYKQRDGHCYKCSYCCDGMLQSGMNVVSGCRRKGMGRCSCTADTKCFQATDNNKQCDALRMKKRKRTF
ncbi:CD27 antigen-like [Rhopilema esculentum]|uniref:CD27 antigen-like n=1 Tax=Rhopilema esculentum TaxID=499914 RepID=UPI0031D98735